MQLLSSVFHIFAQLEDLLRRVPAEKYAMPIPALSGASMGQHVRHVIELFQALLNGYESGIVNYEERKRDRLLETDPVLAKEWLQTIKQGLDLENKSLELHTCDYEAREKLVTIPSNYYREIAYNLEHTIHHMALIRVSAWHQGNYSLPDSFGVAYSTIKYREQCAQ